MGPDSEDEHLPEEVFEAAQSIKVWSCLLNLETSGRVLQEFSSSTTQIANHNYSDGLYSSGNKEEVLGEARPPIQSFLVACPRGTLLIESSPLASNSRTGITGKLYATLAITY